LTELAPGVPRALADAIDFALSQDAGARPDAAGFAALLGEACPAEPVRLAGATVPVAATPTAQIRRIPAMAQPVEPVPSRSERLAAWLVRLGRLGLSPRRLVAMAAVPTALAGAIWGGVAWARSTSDPVAGPASWAIRSTAQPTESPPARVLRTPAVSVTPAGGPIPVPVQPLALVSSTPGPVAGSVPNGPALQAVLAGLDARRDGAFASGDASALAQVYAAGSASLVADTTRLTAMVAAGEHAHGLALQIRTLDVVVATRTAATVRVADQLAPYSLVSADGRVVQQLPARPLTTWAIRLVRKGSGPGYWRIAAISHA
jgi:hypothetical protein